MKDVRAKGVVFALSAALIWGLAFAFQRSASGAIGPFTFNFYRNTLAVASLTPVLLLRRRLGRGSRTPPEKRRQLLVGGLVTGALLFAAAYLQQAGLSGTEAGKAGFLTALYSVLVPLISVALLRRRVSVRLWCSVLLAMAGLYFICIKTGFTLEKSDVLVLGCALVYAVYILSVDHFVSGLDAVLLSCVHFAVSGVLSGIAAFALETPALGALRDNLTAVLYVGVCSSAVGYTLEFAAHQQGNPVAVSLLLCMESVFSVLGGALILGERLTARELFGCGVMFCAVILAQLPETFFHRKIKPAER